MKTTHLYLTGYRGCGKSAVGRRLSDSLKIDFCDLDDFIEQAAGKSIAEIFAAEGESGFRDQEEVCLRKVASEPTRVISLGGGAILRESNRNVITSSGWCVWLDADPQIIAERLAADQSTASRRPSLTNLPMRSEIETIMRQRQPLYASVADHKIDTSSLSIDRIHDEIVDAYRG